MPSVEFAGVGEIDMKQPAMDLGQSCPGKGRHPNSQKHFISVGRRRIASAKPGWLPGYRRSPKPARGIINVTTVGFCWPASIAARSSA